MSQRPELSKDIDAATFREYYYLKEELVDFCRENGLPVSGGKVELTERIAVFLETGTILLKACRYHGNCKECVAIHRAHQEHVPNCMRPLINKKLKLMSELTEHTLANEIEAPHEILRK